MLSSNLCVVCEDSISDPVCRSCYIKQVKFLLNDFKVHFIAKEIILSKIKNKFPIETLNNTGCILCYREDVTICRYCFSIILNNILRELNFSEDIIEDFGFNPMHEDISLERENRTKVEVIS